MILEAVELAGRRPRGVRGAVLLQVQPATRSTQRPKFQAESQLEIWKELMFQSKCKNWKQTSAPAQQWAEFLLLRLVVGSGPQ